MRPHPPRELFTLWLIPLDLAHNCLSLIPQSIPIFFTGRIRFNDHKMADSNPY
jgi:hypothetical protein